MEFAIYKAADDSSPFARGDVVEAREDGASWDQCILDRCVLVRAEMPGSYVAAITGSKLIAPTRRREYGVNLDSLAITGTITELSQGELLALSAPKP